MSIEVQRTIDRSKTTTSNVSPHVKKSHLMDFQQILDISVGMDNPRAKQPNSNTRIHEKSCTAYAARLASSIQHREKI
jgi:hypothetical protein